MVDVWYYALVEHTSSSQLNHAHAVRNTGGGCDNNVDHYMITVYYSLDLCSAFFFNHLLKSSLFFYIHLKVSIVPSAAAHLPPEYLTPPPSPSQTVGWLHHLYGVTHGPGSTRMGWVLHGCLVRS